MVNFRIPQVFKMNSPGWVAKLVGALSCAPKHCGCDSQSEHIPRFRFNPWLGAYRRQVIEKQLINVSHIDVPLSLPPSLHSSLSKINDHIPKWRFFKNSVLTGVALLVGYPPAKWKVTSSIPSQGTCLGLQVLSPVRVHIRGNPPMFDVSLTSPLFPFL